MEEPDLIVDDLHAARPEYRPGSSGRLFETVCHANNSGLMWKWLSLCGSAGYRRVAAMLVIECPTTTGCFAAA
ncbi:hypothetical protein [Nocardia cerradoensis]|uniref:hypothetical protein n=1 Tax=Nocardia cerradoensis TaxID=85688 RepID=UPI0012F65163|nr:hypothetical protein [Nocardia cerradoensis]NKY48367.1 hypothetical protein [Nocardia cerradoensis]